LKTGRTFQSGIDEIWVLALFLLSSEKVITQDDRFFACRYELAGSFNLAKFTPFLE
jgi:hypothetical protein